MNETVIATDHPLTAEQQRTLTAVLNTLLPPSEDGNMPGAGELDFVGYLQAQAESFVPALKSVTDAFAADFVELPLAERVSVVQTFSDQQKALFDGLLLQLYSFYYQQDRVLTGIGMGAGPPFPRGNTLEAGDLSLLDPVLAQPRSYRKPHN